MVFSQSIFYINETHTHIMTLSKHLVNKKRKQTRQHADRTSSTKSVGKI